MPAVVVEHEAPAGERVAVPFHGVPGRGAALRATFTVAQRLRARALVLLEADAVSAPAGVDRAAGPAGAGGQGRLRHGRLRPPSLRGHDLAAACWPRSCARSTGGGCSIRFGGQQALSARLIEHLLIHPKWSWTGPDVSDLWITGTAIADGFGVWEAWLGPHHVRSRTRAIDLPGDGRRRRSAPPSRVMQRHEDLWLEVRGSEPLPAVGEPVAPGVEPMTVDVDAHAGGLRPGRARPDRDLGADPGPRHAGRGAGARHRRPRCGSPTTCGRASSTTSRSAITTRSSTATTCSARSCRSTSGRTAAFVLATRATGAAATQAHLDAVGAAFERQKPYLVEHWR